jgi:hypothetical protein
VALQEVKNSSMEKAAVKDLIYGGLEEIINNRKYYYASDVAFGYNHFTAEGRQSICEFMELMAYKIRESEQDDLNSRAKQQVIDQLKT